jgi:hypothetical protein
MGEPLDAVDRGNEAHGGHGANTGDCHEPPRPLVVGRQGLQLLVSQRNLVIDRLKHDEDALQVSGKAIRILKERTRDLARQALWRRAERPS